jgi:hypothetical protein
MTVVSKKKNSLNNKISGLFKEINPTVSFVMEDGSRIMTPISSKFLKNERGRDKTVNQLKYDLLALQNDYNASYFMI